nr:MAG: putative capsid protein 2 [Polycipiviridae sp.]
MSNQLQENLNLDTHDPVRNYGIPQNPVPQTNTGLLEHVAVPFEPMEQITDIPPDFAWMTEQYKLVARFNVTKDNDVGKIIYYTPVIHSNTQDKLTQNLRNWFFVPFRSSTWWNGVVSYRFTIVKPPRVAGKLLVRYRQDAFKNYSLRDIKSYPGDFKDLTMRSILKEWDLSETNQFSFDITGSLPIRARPTKHAGPSSANLPKDSALVNSLVPWIHTEMGAISIEVAQKISPGSIFPDHYTVYVEKCFKNCNFMTPVDFRSSYLSTIGVSPYNIINK